MGFMKRWHGLSWCGLELVAIGGLAIALTACRTSQPSEPIFGHDQETGKWAASTNATTGFVAETLGRLRVGELLSVSYTDTPIPIPPFDGRIKEDGKITLMQNQEFAAAGKTVAELEKEIHDRYVPKYFVNLTVTVRAQERFFYVDGQVKSPSRQPFLNDITLVGVIAAAGGPTDFAQLKKIKIIRTSGRIEIVNYKKALNDPRLDVPVYPGDRIIVPRKVW
jgi:protein involved in polysaccharide export with SLBB domain